MINIMGQSLIKITVDFCHARNVERSCPHLFLYCETKQLSVFMSKINTGMVFDWEAQHWPRVSTFMHHQREQQQRPMR